MFEIDSSTKREAVNYATMLNVLNMTESRLTSRFETPSGLIPLDAPMDENRVLNEYEQFFHVDGAQLLHTYLEISKSFEHLKETDEIIKRGTFEYPPLTGTDGSRPSFLIYPWQKSSSL